MLQRNRQSSEPALLGKSRYQGHAGTSPSSFRGSQKRGFGQCQTTHLWNPSYFYLAFLYGEHRGTFAHLTYSKQAHIPWFTTTNRQDTHPSNDAVERTAGKKTQNNRNKKYLSQTNLSLRFTKGHSSKTNCHEVYKQVRSLLAIFPLLLQMAQETL